MSQNGLLRVGSFNKKSSYQSLKGFPDSGVDIAETSLHVGDHVSDGHVGTVEVGLKGVDDARQGGEVSRKGSVGGDHVFTQQSQRVDGFADVGGGGHDAVVHQSAQSGDGRAFQVLREN